MPFSQFAHPLTMPGIEHKTQDEATLLEVVLRLGS